MDTSDHPGGGDRILSNPGADSEAIPHTFLPSRSLGGEGGDCINVSKGCNPNNSRGAGPGGLLLEPFHSPPTNGKVRPVLNLKVLNRFVVTSHFKMEGIHTLRDLLTQNDWMTKIDLKDAYFTVPISLGHRKYLRFSFEGRHYQFTCLPFGLSSAPCVFTKTLKPVVALLREQGVRLLVDMLIMARSREEAQEQTAALTFLLTNLGFIVHAEKSILEPAQQMEFLGMVIGSTSQQLRVPGLKIKKLRQECKTILEAATPPPARTVAWEVGKMNAMAHAIAPAPLFF